MQSKASALAASKQDIILRLLMAKRRGIGLGNLGDLKIIFDSLIYLVEKAPDNLTGSTSSTMPKIELLRQLRLAKQKGIGISNLEDLKIIYDAQIYLLEKTP